jgi:hypothetical protein
MSHYLNALQKAENRNCALLDENRVLRRELAVLSGEKAEVDKQLAVTKRRYDCLRFISRKRLTRMDDMEKKLRKLKEYVINIIIVIDKHLLLSTNIFALIILL